MGMNRIDGKPLSRRLFAELLESRWLLAADTMTEDDYPNEPGDDVCQVDIDQQIDGTFHSADDVDVFSFDASVGDTLQVQSNLVEPSQLRILAADGVTEVTAKIFSAPYEVDGWLNSRWKSPTTGRYYLELVGDVVGPYNFTLLREDSASDPGSSIPLLADLANSALNAPYESVKSNIGQAFERDWYRFEAAFDKAYIIEADASHVTLELYDADGFTELASDTDGYNARIVHTPNVAGTRYIRVTMPDNITGSYKVSISEFSNRSIADSSQPNDADLALGFPTDLSPRIVSGNIVAPTQAEAFQFRAVTGPHVYRFDITLGSLADSQLRLVDADGNQLAWDDDGGSARASSLVWKAEQPGIVTASVEGLNSTGTYELSVSVIADDAGDVVDLARPITIGTQVAGVLQLGNEVDVLSFEAEAGQWIRFDTDIRFHTNAKIKVELRLSGGKGIPLTQSERNLWRVPTSGTYYLTVTGQQAAESGPARYEISPYLGQLEK